MAAHKVNKYPDYFIKAEKYKTKLRFRFLCSNLSANSFQKSNEKCSSENLTAEFTHSYNGMTAHSVITILAKNLERFLSGENLPNVKLHKNGNDFCIEFIIDDTVYHKYLDMSYGEIPRQISLYKKCANNQLGAKVEIEVVCDKKPYSQTINYYDKTLPKTVKKQRRTLVAYTGMIQTPLQGGGFSPR